MRYLTIVSVLAVTAASLSGQLPQHVVDRMDRQAESLQINANLPGLAVGVVRNGELVYTGGFGLANRDTGEEVTARTIFQIGSVSKSFTATMLGRMVDRGLIDMDAPIARYLPAELDVPGGNAVLVRHLASHVSGFPRQPPTLRRPNGDFPVLAFTHFEMYRSIEESELESTPGTSFAYSNFGYSVLGHLLERVSGLPYETLLAEELTDSLRMRWTTVTIWPRILPRLARPYYPRSDGTHVDYMPWDTEAMAPAGGIASSVNDLARFVTYMLRANGTPAAFGESVVELGTNLYYGVGWMGEIVDGVGPVVTHGGEVDGYTSYLGFSRQHGVGAIVLTNTGNAPLEELGEYLMREVVGSSN